MKRLACLKCLFFILTMLCINSYANAAIFVAQSNSTQPVRACLTHDYCVYLQLQNVTDNNNNRNIRLAIHQDGVLCLDPNCASTKPFSGDDPYYREDNSMTMAMYANVDLAKMPIQSLHFSIGTISIGEGPELKLPSTCQIKEGLMRQGKTDMITISKIKNQFVCKTSR